MFSSPVTGAANADYLTSPTYTLIAGSAPDVNVAARIVSVAGGTQTGVITHTVDTPFSIWFTWPKAIKSVTAAVLALTGRVANAPTNKWTLTTKKAASINSGGAFADILIRTEISVPVGCSYYSPAQLAAALSLHFGCGYVDADDFAKAIILGSNP